MRRRTVPPGTTRKVAAALFDETVRAGRWYPICRSTLARLANRAAAFIRPVTSSVTYHASGGKTVSKAPAVWTLVHKGYSGGGRLDVWVYPTKARALEEGARLALACGLDEDAKARGLFAEGRFQAVLDLYEAASSETHLLRVQPAFFQFD